MVASSLKMKNSRIFVILVIISILVSISSIAFAEKNLVFDEGKFFSEEEIKTLNQESNRLSHEYNIDIVIVTTDDTMGKSSREFADDYFESGGLGIGEDRSGALFLLDMDNREAYISTSGIAIKYLTDERIESILDMVFDNGLIDGDYHGATIGFLRGMEDYLKIGIPSDQYDKSEEEIEEELREEPKEEPKEELKEEPKEEAKQEPREKNSLTGSDIVLSVLIGIMVGGFFIISVRYRYRFRKAKNPYSYKRNSIVNFSRREDRLFDTIITHRVISKPKNERRSSYSLRDTISRDTTKASSPSPGRSTTHTSSSGKTHGGGGRKF